MTLHEYKNQIEPKRQPAFSVVVKRSECESIHKTESGEFVTLHFKYKHIEKEYFTYFVPKGETGFWTTDDHGNKQHASVFRFEGESNG